MVDQKKLGAWIQPQHLDSATLDAYRSAFTSHPAQLLVIRDFLVPQVAEKLSRFLSTEAEFKVTHGLYSTEVAVSEEEWRQASDDDRLFKLRRLVGTPPQFQTSPNALTYLQFRITFQRPEFKAFFETVSGMTLATSDDFGAQSMIGGDFLRPHSDDNRDRQIAIVIYLSQGWKPEYGGQLRVIHTDGATTVVDAEYNSMIAFNVLTHSAHVVEPVRSNGDAERRRVTIGGWYHKAT